MINYVLRHLFVPPDMPNLPLPLPARWVPGVRTACAEIFKAVYYIGVMDGFLVGFCLAMAIILGIALTGSWRDVMAKGVQSVLGAI